ncbi:MAG: hypothetical protein J5800_02160 [Spirochaetales bacterium]|nr:hypothetical protein [Spirochaetales bacterium]MBO4424161.1 hypothetical protein [Spirochaetales bacterium]HAN42780.1 hypothetical protein [Sphaerochaeta sp.]
MAEFVISLIVAVLGLLGFGIYKTHKLEDQKIKTQEAEARAEVARKQMEVVHEVRKELKVVEEEKPPEKVEAPISGDSDSRLDRLNKLHQH